MSISDDTVQDVNRRILEVVGRYVPLKKAGRWYKGLCPFHSERTPSFMVNPDTLTWHCFGQCSEGGDLIQFIKKIENLNFAQAVEHVLGNHPNTHPTPMHKEEEAPSEPSPFDRLTDQDILDWHGALRRQPDQLTYLRHRGIAKEYIRWRFLGWDGKNITIPWQDTFGNFVGVKLRGKNGYFAINGSTFAPYLYGYETLGQTIDLLILVETELDSLLVNSIVGRSVAVAKPATAIKDYHLHLFDRCRRVVIIPDNDDAGNATVQYLRKSIARLKVWRVPGQYKDIGDWYRQEPKDCVNWLLKLSRMRPHALEEDDLLNYAMVELGGRIE